MANSLKSIFPDLAPILGQTAPALFARQRIFVREGLLESKPGRGPGSGVVASAETLAEFTIAIVCQASVTENVPIAKSIGNAKGHGTTFKKALAGVLADPQGVSQVRIVTNCGRAEIAYDNGTLHRFAGSKTVGNPGLRYEALIERDALRELAKALRLVEP
jgi:hypothetical protein